jgi:hypothetical protein
MPSLLERPDTYNLPCLHVTGDYILSYYELQSTLPLAASSSARATQAQVLVHRIWLKLPLMSPLPSGVNVMLFLYPTRRLTLSARPTAA